MNMQEEKLEENTPDESISQAINEADKFGIINRIKERIERPKEKEIVAFLRELSILIASRVPLVRALNIVEAQTEDEGIKRIAKDMGRKVEGGGSLSEAMEEFPNQFSALYIYVVRAGEASGRLDKVLEYLATHREKGFELRRKLQGALIYPIFILLAFAGVFTFLMVFVMPSLSKTLSESGVPLPWTTQTILAMSNFIVNYWYVVLSLVAAMATGFVYYTRTNEGGRQMDIIKLKIPVFKTVMLYMYVNRFSENLGLLLKESVPITRSLAITGRIMDNHIYYNIAMDCVNEVQKGKTISGVLAKEREYFPPIASQILRIGEEAGQTSMALEKISEYYEKEVNNITQNITALIEPFLILMLGVGTGILVASVIMPIYNMAGSL